MEMRLTLKMEGKQTPHGEQTPPKELAVGDGVL